MKDFPKSILKALKILGIAYGVFIVGYFILFLLHLNTPLSDSEKAQETAKEEETTIAYIITTKDGKCYLNFSNGNDLPPTNGQEPLASTVLRFDSLADMRDTFVNQTLTAQQIKRLKLYFPKDENGILICNVNKLHQPVLPSNMSTYYDIELIGQTYTFTIGDSSVDPSTEEALGTTTGSFLCTNQETYEMHYAEEFAGQFENLTSQTVVADRNATVYEYATKRGEFRVIQYDIIDGAKTLHVSEHYSLSYTDDSNRGNLPISDTVPNRINIFGCQDGEYFEVSLTFFDERPPTEWLSSFGLVEYAK